MGNNQSHGRCDHLASGRADGCDDDYAGRHGIPPHNDVLMDADAKVKVEDGALVGTDATKVKVEDGLSGSADPPGIVRIHQGPVGTSEHAGIGGQKTVHTGDRRPNTPGIVHVPRGWYEPHGHWGYQHGPPAANAPYQPGGYERAGGHQHGPPAAYNPYQPGGYERAGQPPSVHAPHGHRGGHQHGPSIAHTPYHPGRYERAAGQPLSVHTRHEHRGGYERAVRPPSVHAPHSTPERRPSLAYSQLERTPPASSGRSKTQKSDAGRRYTSSSSATVADVPDAAPTVAGTSESSAPAQPKRALSTADFRTQLPDHFQTMMDETWILIDCIAVEGGECVGYLDPFNDAETEALYGTGGLISNYMPLSQNKYDRRRKPDMPRIKRRASNIGPFLFEAILTVYCGTIDCPCQGKIFRLQNEAKNMTGFLYYEKVDPTTNSTLVHQNHNRFPLELRPGSGKATEVSLSGAQKEYIQQQLRGKKATSEELRNIVIGLVASTDIRTSTEQENNGHRFLSAVTNYVKYMRGRSKSQHTHFGTATSVHKTSGPELQIILNHLTSASGTDERKRIFTSDETNSTPYLSSSDFKQVNKLIRVHRHDHDGKLWTHITFEYLFAGELAKRATEMYPDKRVQLEMDFFLSVCDGNEWQVGHIGFSDTNHKYWILALIIAKSENHAAAGKLIERAIELLKENGGDGIYTMVDGGKALEKAIGVENESRLAKLAAGPDNAVEPRNATAQESWPTDADGRLGEVLENYKLGKIRCLAHITRNMGRGGGWRGPKGSLCRALLNHGVSKKQMQKILGIVFMMSKIPCGDTATFRNALGSLLEKYGKHIHGNIRTSYFNGNPRDLGGCCCHRPGEMMSTQGCEKRGGEVKRSHSEVLNRYSAPKNESRNPLHILAAVARDATFHLHLGEPLGKLSVEPPRKGVFAKYALDELRHLSDYKPPKILPAGSNKKQKVVNMRATWLYSAVVVDGEEVAPEDVLGKKSTSFQWQFPTASRVLTSVSMMKRDTKAAMSGGVSELQGGMATNEGRQLGLQMGIRFFLIWL